MTIGVFSWKRATTFHSPVRRLARAFKNQLQKRNTRDIDIANPQPPAGDRAHSHKHPDPARQWGGQGHVGHL